MLILITKIKKTYPDCWKLLTTKRSLSITIVNKKELNKMFLITTILRHISPCKGVVHQFIPWSFLFFIAEVPGAARVYLQPAEHHLFFKQFSKKCPSVFRVSGPQRPRWGRGQGSNLHQNLSWTGRDVCAKFHQDWCRGLDFHY